MPSSNAAPSRTTLPLSALLRGVHRTAAGPPRGGRGLGLGRAPRARTRFLFGVIAFRRWQIGFKLALRYTRFRGTGGRTKRPGERQQRARPRKRAAGAFFRGRAAIQPMYRLPASVKGCDHPTNEENRLPVRRMAASPPGRPLTLAGSPARMVAMNRKGQKDRPLRSMADDQALTKRRPFQTFAGQ